MPHQKMEDIKMNKRNTFARSIKSADILALAEELKKVSPPPKEERRLTREEALSLLKGALVKLYEDGHTIKDIVGIVNQRQHFIKIREQDVRNALCILEEDNAYKEKTRAKRRVKKPQEAPKATVEQSQGGEEGLGTEQAIAEAYSESQENDGNDDQEIGTSNEDKQSPGSRGTFELTQDDPDL